MRKLRKIAVGLLILGLMIIQTSCVKRRMAYLERQKLAKENTGKNMAAHTGVFYPDNITEFSMEEYLKWYKDLKAPPHLQLASYENPKKLSKSEMIGDFEYLFKELKESYPFFEVLKRKYEIDFLKNHDTYLKKVRACKTEADFIKTLNEVMADLHNYHAKIADSAYVDTTLKYYSQNWNQPSIYYEFLNLNRQVVRNRYGLDGVQSQSGAGLIKRKQSKTGDSKANISLESQGDMAILKISQMGDMNHIDQDEKVLDEFLKNKHMYKALVIDIRDNVGGNMEYWQNFLLPKLTKNPKQVVNHMFFKDSPKIRLLLQDNTLNMENLSNVDITGIRLDHPEDLKDFAYYIKDTISINPDETKRDNGYEGPIFLLVDEGVFSAAEGFASFIKNTEFATIVGSQTGGDGITLGVINSVLPNSGLVFTYTNTLGYDPTGQINEENPTKPDIETTSYRQSIETIEKMIEN
ncbi:S41 family peptidase [uncultured Anaerococcus sp.]|uniref:S41 family peptidase n=1 Tax=uncultured Anaerococcus sp. TaxID=293428 RepID=UPI00288A445C|nr:S41 family peptidase [uncultured Anaerococcus sp.]